MITVGVTETKDGTEYFAVVGGWASQRSYPGLDGLRRACAECIAYQEWLLGRRQQTFDEYWEQYWLDLERDWTEVWEQDHWSEMLSPGFIDAKQVLPADIALTLSPFADAARRYSFVETETGTRGPDFETLDALIKYVADLRLPGP